MKKPPSVLAVIGKAITDITGDPHQGRLEVAEAVVAALAKAGLCITVAPPGEQHGTLADRLLRRGRQRL